MTDVATDAKAGFCSNCRRGDHSLCASASCTCPDRRKHRNRPGIGEVSSRNIPTERPLRPVPASKPTAAKSQPVIELVAEDPPVPEPKLTLVEQIVRAITDGSAGRRPVVPGGHHADASGGQGARHQADQARVTERMRLEWQAAEAKVFVKGPA